MISVRVGRLEETETEGLLRPVRSDLSGISGASRRVDSGVGEKVRARMDGMGELPVGGAVVTPGGNLRVAFVIHAVLESPEESISTFGVQRALVNGLRRAREWEMASLSLPPFGLSAGALEPEEVAGMVVEVLLDHVREGGPPAELVIVVETTYEEELFRRLLASAQI
jgi:O-acetyl-ADP-ribose deacetylase (regulator of RNase III)